ncbi:adenylate/guanylate cyclase domain-containing protein [Microbaculum sp. FT89]|uniref:adenylate/guanylate cyclase domain-containing protein n=1 Tax=Microbaculum sp. FT89 TaxID=3447298 RepID=UPI003F53D38B
MRAAPESAKIDGLFDKMESRAKAVLFADVVGSARLFKTDDDDAIRSWLSLVGHVQAELLPEHRGRLVKNLGDGIFTEFQEVADAVRFAFAITVELDHVNASLPSGRKMHLRVGIDVGDVLTTHDNDLYGQHVNIAARLMSVARPGEIVATAEVRDALSNELDAEFEDIGECHLKNVAHPVRAFRVHPIGTHPSVVPLLRYEDLLPTVAVIPFAPRSRSRDHYALGEVLAEELIVALSRSSELNVISRLSTTGFRMRESPLAQIGQTLKADFVMSGTYSGDRDHVVLDIELAEVKSGRVIWSSRISENVPDLLKDAAAIYQIAKDCQNAILRTEMQLALSSPMQTLEAYSLLMSAVGLIHRLSRRHFGYAGELLEELIQRSSSQPATALAWKAKWHVLSVQQGWTDSPARETALALQCTQNALDYDPTNVPALVAEGFALTNLAHRLDEAEHRYDMALDYNPNDAMGRLLRGTLYAFKGQGEAAMTDTELALHLSPIDPHRYFYLSLAASAAVAAENYERALELSKLSLRSNRAHTSTLRVKAVAEMRLGQVREAKQTVAELLSRQPDLTVHRWLETSPSASFKIGREFAETLKQAGLPP